MNVENQAVFDVVASLYNSVIGATNLANVWVRVLFILKILALAAAFYFRLERHSIQCGIFIGILTTKQ